MIYKNMQTRLAEAQRDNEQLRAELAAEHEKVQFLALLAADIDIDTLMTEEEAQNNERIL